MDRKDNVIHKKSAFCMQMTNYYTYTLKHFGLCGEYWKTPQTGSPISRHHKLTNHTKWIFGVNQMLSLQSVR